MPGTDKPGPQSSTTLQKRNGTSAGQTDGTGATGATGPHAVSGATGPSAATGSTAGPPSNGTSELFPLGVGYTWTYAWASTGVTAPSGCETLTYGITGVSGSSGNAIYMMAPTPNVCGYGARYKHDATGDVYVSSDDTYWYLQLDTPPVLHHTFAAGAPSGVVWEWVEAFPSFATKAFVFGDCWKRKQVGYDVWDVHCAGVGTVFQHYDAWGTFQEYELSGASF